MLHMVKLMQDAGLQCELCESITDAKRLIMQRTEFGQKLFRVIIIDIEVKETGPIDSVLGICETYSALRKEKPFVAYTVPAV